MKLLKHYQEYQKHGSLIIDQNLHQGLHHCDLGVAFDIWGKIWLCMNHQSIMRFRLMQEPKKWIIKPFREYHQRGELLIGQDLQTEILKCEFKIMFNREGKIWVYIDHKLIFNFEPFQFYQQSKMSDASDKVR